MGTGKTVAFIGRRPVNVEGVMLSLGLGSEHKFFHCCSVSFLTVISLRRHEDQILQFGEDGRFIVLPLEPAFRRILFISGRKSFTRFISALVEAEGIPFAVYSDVAGTDTLSSLDRVIIQVESLWRLENGFMPYDCVIIDESETVLNQLYSKKTNGEYLSNHEQLERGVSTCEKLLSLNSTTFCKYLPLSLTVHGFFSSTLCSSSWSRVGLRPSRTRQW